jgi:hypothetical protein
LGALMYFLEVVGCYIVALAFIPLVWEVVKRW